MGLALGIFELPDRWWPARASSVASRSRGPLQCSDCKSSSPWPRSQLCAYIISPPGRGRVLAPLPPRRPHGYTHRLCVHGSIVISSSYTPVAAPAPRPANLQKSLSRPGCHRVRPTQQLPLSLSLHNRRYVEALSPAPPAPTMGPAHGWRARLRLPELTLPSPTHFFTCVPRPWSIQRPSPACANHGL